MHLTPASIPPLITAVAFAAFGFFTFPKGDRRGGNKGYALWCFVTVYWQGSWAILFNIKDPNIATILVHTGYIGIAFIPVTFYHFAIGFLKKDPGGKRVPLLYAIAGLFAATSVTTKGLVSGMYHYDWGYYPKAGPLHPIYLCFLSVVVGHALWLLLKTLRSNTLGDVFRKNTRVVLLAPIIYTFAAVDFLPNYGVGIYPFGFIFTLVSLFLVAYAILHYQLLDIRLILRDTTVNLVTGALLGGGILAVTLPISTINSTAGTLLSVICMGLLMVFGYDPIRRSIQPTIDRIVFANRFAYLEELAQLPNDILEFTNLREMLKFLVTRLVEAGRLDHATVLMYDPGFQAYITTIHHSADVSKETQRLQWNIPRGNPLIELLRSTKRLLTKEEIQASKRPDVSVALETLKELDAAACFGVITDDQLSALVSLGPKQNGEPFNQRDLKILGALKIRVENFLVQAMVTTQESLNMVRDSHDMKNDINSLRGRLPWKGYKIETARDNLLNQITVIQTHISAIPNLSEEEKGHLLGSLKDVSNEVTRSSQEQYSFLPIEADSLDRLKIKIQNWSEYGRLVAGGFKGDRKFEPVDIKSTVERCVQRWKASAERKNIALVEESEENMSAFGERSLIEQIIENLIDNGLKATDKGYVKVASKRINDKILIEISDTGCGMTQEDLADILKKPFYQGQGREALERSTGIGLVLVHTYAKSMGGEVQAESTVGQGTSFKVFLPISRSAVSAADKTIAA